MRQSEKHSLTLKFVEKHLPKKFRIQNFLNDFEKTKLGIENQERIEEKTEVLK